MSSLFRSIGSRLQTSSTARLVLYGTAATATSFATWKYHAQSRKERELLEQHRKVAAIHPKVEQSPRPPPLLDTQHTPSHTGDRSTTTQQETPIDLPVDTENQEAGANTGAFDPETGEINWDCPCLGGMAHGPCGLQFRAAFSCFVYSEAEPKGMDCVEKFREMQDCFRAHPDVYAEGDLPTWLLTRLNTELRDDDEPIDDDIQDSSNSAPSGPSSTAGGEGLEPPSPPKPPAKPPAGEDKLPHSPPPLPPSEPVKGPPALPPAPPSPPTIIDPPAGPITSLPGATRSGSESS